MENIEHAFYINLESRPDRNEHCKRQLKNIGINATRFNAIKLANGAIGCSMSHLKCLQIAKENKWDHVLIIEDDIEFTNPEYFKSQFDQFLTNQKDWDVVLLAGNNMPPYEIINDYCIKVKRCQTTTSYMVKGHYFDKLIENIKEGLHFLMKDPTKHKMYAIDKYWFQLQEKDNWFLIIPLTITQRQDYSDIENKITNYTNLMLDLDKKSLFLKNLEQIKIAKEQLISQPTSILQQTQQLLQLKKLEQIEEQIKKDMDNIKIL